VGKRALYSTLGRCAAVVVALTATSAAYADDPKAEKDALALFEQSKVAYREGRFDEAIDLLKKAYAIHAEPVLLYNLARAYEGVGNFEEAIDAYERYLKDATEIADRPAIEQRVAGLRRSVDEKSRLARERDEAKRAQTARAAPAPAHEARQPSVLPWALAGVGGATAIAGGVLGILALGKHDDADAARSQVDARAAQDRAEGLGLGATVAFVAGGAIAGAGITWGIIDVLGAGSSAKSGQRRLYLVAGASFIGVRGALP